MSCSLQGEKGKKKKKILGCHAKKNARRFLFPPHWELGDPNLKTS